MSRPSSSCLASPRPQPRPTSSQAPLRCPLLICLVTLTLVTQAALAGGGAAGAHAHAAAAAAHPTHEAVGLHMGRFGPLGPDAGFADALAAAAMHVEAQSGEPGGQSEGQELPGSCQGFPLVLLMVVDHGLMDSTALELIQSLARIPAATGGAGQEAGGGGECGWLGSAGDTMGASGLQRQQLAAGKPGAAGQGLDAYLLVVAVDRQAATLCEASRRGLKHRCVVGSNVKATRTPHHGRHVHLGLSRARYLLDALTLGFGVLHLDLGLGLDLDGAEGRGRGFKLMKSPLQGMLGRTEDMVVLGLDGGGGGDCGGGGGAGEVLLVRPTSAAARCVYDWVVSMSGAMAGPGAGAQTELQLQSHFQAVPDCITLFGSGFARVSSHSFI